MKLGIMQPYFLPYIGYFQLIAAVDVFVVYDNIKYTKKGWINRNRMLKNGQDVMFSLPLKSDSDFLDVHQREIAADFSRTKLINQFRGTYLRAPFFKQTFPLIERIVGCEERNLFKFLYQSIIQTCEHLGIRTEIKISSSVAIDHSLKNQEKVLAICSTLGASTYINSIGGRELYAKESFQARGVQLQFIQSKPFEYPQFGGEFVPWLSIVDILMFNSLEKVRATIDNGFDLL